MPFEQGVNSNLSAKKNSKWMKCAYSGLSIKLFFCYFFMLVSNFSFAQDVIAERSLLGLKFKIPPLEGFSILDSTTASGIITNGTVNAATFYYGEGFKAEFTLHVQNNIAYNITTKQFESLKQVWRNLYKDGGIINDTVPLQTIIQFAEKFYSNKPDTLKFIKEKISGWKGEVKLTVRNPTIFYNSVYGLMMRYSVNVENGGLSITLSAQFAGCFLLKNKYFIFGGSVSEDSIIINKIESNLKTFAVNLISLNK